MLPPFYTKKEDIPAALAEHYALRQGQWVLELDKEHPVMKKNAELLGINSALKTDNQKLTDEKDRLDSKILPAGKIAVEPAIAELGETAQSLGLKKRDIAELRAKAETAETKLAERDENEIIHKAAAAAGKNEKAFSEHARANNLKFKETTVKDAKGNDIHSFIVLTKGADDREVETPLKDYAEKNAAYVAAEKPKSRFNFPKEKGAAETGNKFEQIREKVREENGITRNGNQSFAEKFHRRPAATQTK